MLLSLGALLAAGPLGAQQPIVPGSERDAYLRLLEIQGGVTGTPIVFHSLSANRAIRVRSDSTDLWRVVTDSGQRTTDNAFRLIGPELRLTFNSAYPRAANDGAVWAGKGVTTAVSGGAEVRWSFVTATFFPTVYYAQNRAFPLDSVPFPNRSVYAYQWQRNIDWPQRMGPDAITTFDWGQSGVRLDWRALTAGFSTENMWWGPGYRNAIIMSNAGPGFPHADLGTGHPVRTGIGDLEFRLVWGGLSQSQYFDTIPDNGRRYLAALTLGYRPSFIPGLNLGITRVRYEQWPSGGLEPGDLFKPISRIFLKRVIELPGGVKGNDTTDQLASLSARWVLPESGFEAYFEWARNDFSENLTDFLVEPEHSRGYTLGFAQSVPSGSGRIRISGEHTTLGQARTTDLRASPTYYQHDLITQGYTHRGQLLGAAIGPGGTAQYLGLDRYTAAGRWGVFLQRVRFDDDAYYRIFRGTQQFHAHQTEFTAGASVYRLLGKLELGGSLEVSRELNRYFQLGNHVTNLTAGMSLRRR